MRGIKIDQQKNIIKILFFTFLFIMATALVIPGSSMEAMAKSLSSDTPGSFSDLVKSSQPSVVNISTVTVVNWRDGFSTNPFGEGDPFGDLFERFYNQMPREDTIPGLGTGFIIDEEGYILTNNHLVESANEIKVTLSDEREFDARVIGYDSKTDIALLKIDDATDLKPVPLGDSDKVEVGDWVVAIGNPFGLENTVTAGIVSAKYRRNITGGSSYENFIQTDASINQGNSGGPLMNTNGEVIGINTQILSTQSGGSIGIGFAIPINMAKDLLPQLKKGKVVRGWLGVIVQPIDSAKKDKFGLKDEKGALVGDVTKGGPAEDAGFQRGDVIVAFNGKEINESDELPFIVGNTPVGENVPVDILRDGKKRTINVKLGELKDDEEEASPEIGSAGGGGPNLGLSLRELTPDLARRYGLEDTSGLIIVNVDSNSPAGEAGLERGDIILEIDQEPVNDLAQFNRKINEYEEGETILFLVKHQGSTYYITLEVR